MRNNHSSDMQSSCSPLVKGQIMATHFHSDTSDPVTARNILIPRPSDWSCLADHRWAFGLFKIASFGTSHCGQNCPMYRAQKMISSTRCRVLLSVRLSIDQVKERIPKQQVQSQGTGATGCNIASWGRIPHIHSWYIMNLLQHHLDIIVTPSGGKNTALLYLDSRHL